MALNNDLPLYLLYLDYPFPPASMYFNHDDYDFNASMRSLECRARQ